MKVINVHQRLLHASPDQVGALIDSLASPNDSLWPRHKWPRMAFDRPLGVGAAGGHGPIGYFVEAYTPGQAIRFQFTKPAGFNGWHSVEVVEATARHCVLEHRIEMNTSGLALLTWPLFIRPLHDACVEDLLSLAQSALGNTPKPVSWSPWVRMLQWLGQRMNNAPARPTRASHAN